MTPGARLQAAIDLLHEIHAGTSPADRATAAFFRNRRYIGAKDRREVLDRAYAVLRRRAALDWWIWKSGQKPKDHDRARLIAALALLDGWTADRIAGSFDGTQYHPDRLDEAERWITKTLAGKAIESGEQPADVRHEYPEWIEPLLRARFGNRMDAEMRAAMTAASTDLRANTIKATREEAIAALKAEGISAMPTELSPVGLRVHGRPPLATLKCFQDGLIEVQDEGSQIVGLLVDAQPGMRVADFCAGAGGKTLAIAAQMKNKGKIVACDVLEGRIDRAAVRFIRAGVHNVERKALSSERDQWVKRHAGTFDRVLVDAPCTGTGTWRRNPDAKWKLSPEDLTELTQIQRNILDSAWRLVKPGGRLIYATCSLLAEENEAQIATFLGAHADFKLVPVGEVWREIIGAQYPHSIVTPADAPGSTAKASVGPSMNPGALAGMTVEREAGNSGSSATLSLTPAQHGTDGFFVAIMERVKVPKKSAFKIRPAIDTDAHAIAEIHYAGWQIAYANVVSDEQMEAKQPERRIPLWQARIADPKYVVLIAEDETGKAQGFVYAGDVLAHDIRTGGLTGYDCEIYSLHCRLDMQGKGLGRLLMAETAYTFRERGRTALMLWAYRDNAYRRFYEKIGGTILAEGLDDDIPDVAYGWPLVKLTASAGAKR